MVKKNPCCPTNSDLRKLYGRELKNEQKSASRRRRRRKEKGVRLATKTPPPPPKLTLVGVWLMAGDHFVVRLLLLVIILLGAALVPQKVPSVWLRRARCGHWCWWAFAFLFSVCWWRALLFKGRLVQAEPLLIAGAATAAAAAHRGLWPGGCRILGKKQ